MEQEFTQQLTHAIDNIAHQLYGAILKDVKKRIKLEGEDYATGHQQGLAEGKRVALEKFPMWKIAPKDDYIRETVLAAAGEFGFRIVYRGQLIKEGWKYISIKALKFLPTEVVEEEE